MLSRFKSSTNISERETWMCRLKRLWMEFWKPETSAWGRVIEYQELALLPQEESEGSYNQQVQLHLDNMHLIGLQQNRAQVQNGTRKGRGCARGQSQRDHLLLHRQLKRKYWRPSFRGDSDSHGWLLWRWGIVRSSGGRGSYVWKGDLDNHCPCQPSLPRPHWDCLPDFPKPSKAVGEGQNCPHQCRFHWTFLRSLHSFPLYQPFNFPTGVSSDPLQVWIYSHSVPELIFLPADWQRITCAPSLATSLTLSWWATSHGSPSLASTCIWASTRWCKGTQAGNKTLVFQSNCPPSQSSSSLFSTFQVSRSLTASSWYRTTLPSPALSPAFLASSYCSLTSWGIVEMKTEIEVEI